jgi:isoquinoline 1-oxidoreductase subunit alpha
VIDALVTKNAPVKNAPAKNGPAKNDTVTKINVNGTDHELKGVSGETPLLWVLRDHLGLTGTKYGCGISECGACTVHLDGAAVQSCVTSLADVGNSKVVTIEGLSQHGDHPVQKAWMQHNVPQCGYCQPGQMMQAAALLSKNKNPSDKEIEAQMWNICRCGTYPRIRAAIKTAAKDVRQ